MKPVTGSPAASVRVAPPPPPNPDPGPNPTPNPEQAALLAGVCDDTGVKPEDIESVLGQETMS